MTPPTHSVKVASGTWTLGLFDPGMTDLHRTGLAGLAMTLAAWERQGKTIPGGTWQVTRGSVRLDWEDEAFLKAIVDEGLALGDDGLIAFPGLGPELDRSQRITLHAALLGTFLQHNKSVRRRKDAAGKPDIVRLSYEIDGETFTDQYAPLMALLEHGVVEDGLSVQPARLSVHLYPGAGNRHERAPEHNLFETSGLAFLLRFTLVGACFYQIVHPDPRQAKERGRPAWCVVLPHVVDLHDYIGLRRALGSGSARDLRAAGGGEAALHFLAHQKARQDARALGVAGCTVIGFGQRAWNPSQQIRVSRVRTGDVPMPILRTYTAIRGLAPPRLIAWADRKTGERRTRWVVAPILELVATNLLAQRAAWAGFGAWWQEIRDEAQGNQRDWVLRDNKEAIRAMTSQLTGSEAILVQACHEAWRRRAGALAEQKGDFRTRYRNKFEETRIAFSRCKTPDMFRATITDFWVRAGSLPALRDNWQDVIPFLGPRWEEGRDLALLALASYQGRGAEIATEETTEADEITTEVAEA